MTLIPFAISDSEDDVYVKEGKKANVRRARRKE
jgi:hypothetical protein